MIHITNRNAAHRIWNNDDLQEEVKICTTHPSLKGRFRASEVHQIPNSYLKRSINEKKPEYEKRNIHTVTITYTKRVCFFLNTAQEEEDDATNSFIFVYIR